MPRRKPDIAIYGAGGLGRLVLDIVNQADRFRVVAFLDSDTSRVGSEIDGIGVLGGLELAALLCRKGVRRMIVAIGENHTRVRVAGELCTRGGRLVSAVHPLATIAPTAKLGEHVIVGARAIVCVHATVADHSVLSAGAIIEHDNRIGAGAFLHPAVRLAGNVTVEEYATLGIGACVIQGRRIGRGAVVHPGAVVIRDVPPGMTVSGAPARMLAATSLGIEAASVAGFSAAVS